MSGRRRGSGFRRHADASEAARVAAHARTTPGDPESWAEPPDHTSVALAAIDAVWGIGVRWTSVRAVLERYRAAHREAGGDPETDGPAELLALIESAGGADGFAELVRNRQRTSTRNGILKAEAIRLIAEVLRDAGIDVPADIRDATPERLAALRATWTEVPGHRGGLSLDAFLMVCGLAGVNADRMVRRFVADALDSPGEQSIAPARAAALVQEAAALCGVEPRRLDAAIWAYQSARRPVG